MSKTFKVGLVGAGTMGSGIAQKMAQEGLSVVMVDLKDEFVEKGFRTIRETLQQGVERKIFTPARVEEILSRIRGTTDLHELADADLVVEAVFEEEKIKGELFRRLDEICSPHTVLATNTSSFFVRNLARWTKRPERVVGMHYFFHPAKNRLLEVIPHEGTGREALEKALLIARLHGKTAIVVKDAPGFAVNRIFIPWYVEAIRMVEEGVANIPTMDEATKRAFGIGMGVFELMNVSGVPIGLHAARTLSRELGSFYSPPELLRRQVEDLKADFDLSGAVDESKMELIAGRLYATVFGVAAALVEEGVAGIEDVDRGTKIGLAWRHGPFELMNRLGIEKAYRLVMELSERRPDFKMPALLARQREKGLPFTFNYVDLEVKGGLAYITFNRPEAMNALNPVVVEQLEHRFNEAEGHPAVRAIVFRGAGKAFVAGADIKFFVDNIKSDSLDKTYAFTRKGHDLLLRIENAPKMTIALLDGLSLGGGSEVALACQAIVATPQGSFGFPETGIGIFPGLGGLFRLARHLGPELAKYYVFTGLTISAADAYDLGLVTRLVERTEIDRAIEELVAGGKFDKYRPRELPARFAEAKAACTAENAARLIRGEAPQGVDPAFAAKTAAIVASKAPLALRLANELIDAQQGVSFARAIELELARLYEIFSTRDALAGLQSPPGRPPQYEGR